MYFVLHIWNGNQQYANNVSEITIGSYRLHSLNVTPHRQ